MTITEKEKRSFGDLKGSSEEKKKNREERGGKRSYVSSK